MSSIHYYSLQRQSPTVNFKQAAVSGQAPDKGLYFPSSIPKYNAKAIKDLLNLTKEEIGYTVMQPYTGASIPLEILRDIVAETVNFPFPLVKVSDKIYSLELFHGPTLAFKDVGARFMSRCLGYFNRNEDTKTTVLVATSGDTGGAVANGFLGVGAVEVIILYPKGKVSLVQELQLTTCGQNITALEVDGNFDACQAIVKQAFADTNLTERYKLTSANSINVARWLPQQLYYFYALQQWEEDDMPVISVPSGNFGNLCAGMLAWASGLPVKHFIAACNANSTIPDFLESGKYKAKPSVATSSNAMDVGDPSNFVRILEIFHQNLPTLKNCMSSNSISDLLTKETIQRINKQFHYMLDPHGAVGYYALEEHLWRDVTAKGIFLETAHPVKFPELVKDATGMEPGIPESVAYLFEKQKQSIPMSADYETFQEWMLSRKK